MLMVHCHILQFLPSAGWGTFWTSTTKKRRCVFSYSKLPIYLWTSKWPLPFRGRNERSLLSVMCCSEKSADSVPITGFLTCNSLTHSSNPKDTRQTYTIKNLHTANIFDTKTPYLTTIQQSWVKWDTEYVALQFQLNIRLSPQVQRTPLEPWIYVLSSLIELKPRQVKWLTVSPIKHQNQQGV